MEQKKQICTSDELVTLSSDYPWLVAHDLDPEEDDTGDQIFYPLHDPMSHYRCRIPELVGRRIQGCFHGWVILLKRNLRDMEWSLWNPITSKLIWLPRMILEDDRDLQEFHYCWLSSPPDDPGSLLLLMSSTKPQRILFVFCNDERRKRLGRWMEESYSEQMKNLPQFRDRGGALLYPTCCNGNLYALTYAQKPPLLMQVQITVVEEEQVVINLVPLVNLPWPRWKTFPEDYLFLKASCTQLFCVRVCLDTKNHTPCHVYLYELDMGNMVWTEIKDLKDTVFFVSLAQDYDNYDLVYSIPPIASELWGGYIHILEDSGDEIYSYNIKDKTISMSSSRCLGLPYYKSLSIWTITGFRLPVKAKCKLQGDHDQIVQLVRSATPTTTNDDDDEVEQMNEAPLLNVPFDVLENIIKCCVGIEYLSFRATCKLCRLAAPMQTFSSACPWLMVLDKDRGIVAFTDPVFGKNNYLIKAPPELFYHDKILCSRHGWLLLYIADCRIAFFNPFTTDICKLPELPEPLYGGGISFSFSAPPTSLDCMVVAFSSECRSNLTFHRVGGEPSWYTIPLRSREPHNGNFSFPICWGEDVYALFKRGGLQVFRGVQHRDKFSNTTVVKRGPERSDFAKYYQVKCDQHHLLVIVEDYGGTVEVFKLNDCTQEWEEVDGLGRHMIYICDASCVCMDAKTPEMENKIYFPRLHSENGKIVFYSLETSMFHTFNGGNVEQNLTNLFGTKQTVCLHAWIEPTWT